MPKTYFLCLFLLLGVLTYSQDYYPLSVGTSWSYNTISISAGFFSGTKEIYGREQIEITGSSSSADTVYYFRKIVKETDSVFSTPPISPGDRVKDTTHTFTYSCDTLKQSGNSIFTLNNAFLARHVLAKGDSIDSTLFVCDSTPMKIMNDNLPALVICRTGGFFGTQDERSYYCDGFGLVRLEIASLPIVMDAGWSYHKTLTAFTLPVKTDQPLLNIRSSNLFGISPNPFNSFVKITFPGAFSNNAIISIYSIQGKLIDNFTANGKHLNWKPRKMNAGIYIISIKSGSFSSKQKITYLK